MKTLVCVFGLAAALMPALAVSALPAPSPLVNVRDFGAKGDGETDDTGAIQKAIDSLEKTGGVVFFPAGDYRITKTLLISGSHNNASKPTDSLEIRGESQMASRLLGDGVDYILAAKTVLDAGGKRQPIFGMVLNRLTFASYRKDPDLLVGGLDASYMLRWTCRQCIFIGLKTGIYSLSHEAMADAAPDSMAVYIIRIQNNVFYGCTDYGIKLGRIFDLVIENNEIEHGIGGIAVGWPGDGFDASANTIRIVDNLIEGLGPGEPAIKGACWIGGRIVGNYLEANAGGDIELTPRENDGWLRGITIASNTFQPTEAQRKSRYGPIYLTKTIDAVISGNFTTNSTLLHPDSGPLGKGVNIFSNILNNPPAIGDIKGAKPGNPSDYIGKMTDLSLADAERMSVSGPIAGVGMHALRGFQYAPAGENARSIAYGTSAPTGDSVRHETGDLILNLTPAAGPKKKITMGWVCVEAGEPGVWKPLLADTEE